MVVLNMNIVADIVMFTMHQFAASIRHAGLTQFQIATFAGLSHLAVTCNNMISPSSSNLRRSHQDLNTAPLSKVVSQLDARSCARQATV